MGLFTTEGILRKKNLKDVPKPIEGLTNILKAAYSNKMVAEDIKIVDGASTYGAPFTEYYYTREYARLKDVLLQDTTKPKSGDGTYENALPIQTINNRLAVGTSELGALFPTGGGDGLKIEYYNWLDVYGQEQDIKAESGGSYVEGQGESSTATFFSTNLDVAYASPNTFVAPTDSEAFFDFKESDLDGKVVAATEIGWNKGVFNFGQGSFHPSISNVYNAGIVKMSGYFNSGSSIINSVQETGIIFDRIHILSESSKYGDEAVPYAGTSVPVIVKMWEVDQDTGVRLTSDSSPMTIARYAPGYTPYDTELEDQGIESGRSNSPFIYSFATTSFGGINDQLYSPSDPYRHSGVFMGAIGSAYIVAKKTDGSPAINTTGTPGTTKKQNIIPFPPEKFFSIEIYLILSPRASTLLGDLPKSALFEGYEAINNRTIPIPDSSFWSQNPLAKDKGAIYETLRGSIPRSGTFVSGNTSPFTDASPRYRAHLEPIGSPGFGTAVDNDYTQLFSGQRIDVTYKPPRTWSDIHKVTYNVANTFGKQFTAPHLYTDTMYIGSVVAGIENNMENGNLVIDKDSPTPRKGQDYTASPSGSIFAPFTYIKKKNRVREYVTLSRPTIRFKNPAIHGDDDTVTIDCIDHRGLKGYGRGKLIRDTSGIGPLANDIGLLDFGNEASATHSFYVGERITAKDIIIFEGYGEDATKDSPFLEVYDSPDPGSLIKVAQLSSNGNKPEVTGGIDRTRIKVSSGTTLFPFDSTDNTPGGRNFFVYRHRGLVDESLDGFCSVSSSVPKIYEALVGGEVLTTDSPLIPITRTSISSYTGDNIIRPFQSRDSSSPGTGILGQVADYNGLSSPSGAKAPIINKVLDHRFANTITISGFTGGSYTVYNGVYKLDSYPYKPTNVDSGDIAFFYDTKKAEYGNPKPGRQFYYKNDTNASDRRIRLFHEDGKYKLVSNTGVLIASFNSDNSPFAGGANISFTNEGSTTGTGIIESHVSRNSPLAPFGFLLTHPTSPCSDQTLLQDLKVGFGITISTDANKAATHFQCFKPTDTAPPFRATEKGIRTIPEENLASVTVGASDFFDTPGSRFTSNAITTITVSEIKVIGAYGDNSPGITASVPTTHKRMTDSPDYSPGGIISLDATNPAITYDQRVLFDYINLGGSTGLPYSILASSTHASVSP